MPSLKPRARRWPRRLALGAALTVLLALAAGALVTGALARRAERDYPMLGELVQVEGLRQHVLIRGDGPPVVFVHGAFGGMQDWAVTVLGEASRRYRCVLWDRPGHGYSERPDGRVGPGVQARLLLDLVRVLKLERPLLVGFSYGGAVVLTAALEAPNEVRGVVLVNGPSHAWPDPLDLEYRLDDVPLVGWLVAQAVAAPLAYLVGDGAVERAFEPLPVPALFARSPQPLALRPASYRANMEDVRLLKPFLRVQAERYGELAVPVVALVAEGDTVVSPTIHIPQLVAATPRVRQVRVPGAGHQLPYTHPELVLAAIEEMMGK